MPWLPPISKKLASLKPGDQLGALNAGIAANRLGDFKNSLMYLRQAQAAGMNTDQLLYALAYAEHMNGDDRSACSDWHQARSMGNKDAEQWIKEFCQ